jgi:CheY-like chemotaxis protein
MNNPPLLLIVDDSRTSRMLVRGLVARLRPEWRLIEAASGEEALAAVEKERPDFISMDVNMPGMGGLAAAGQIRLREPVIRIVLCTANIQEAVRAAAERAGVGFVAKPVTENSITQSISFFENP